jgi:signal transduction histidine kinase
MKKLSSNQKACRGSKAEPRCVPARTEPQQGLTEVVRQREAVSEVLRAIACSPHDLQPIFDTILGSATRLCRANAGTLRLREEKGFRLVAHLLDPNTLERWSPPMLVEPSSSLFAHLANGSPIHIPDFQLAHDPDFDRDPGVAHAAKQGGLRTLLCAPMLAEGRIIGTIHIWRVRVQPFTNKEIELITDFATQAAIALEITRRERQLGKMQIELAHANRVATVGELTASIAHEVKQPIAATVCNAQAALRWLAREPPELEEARRTLARIVTVGVRAGRVVDRTRDLIQKAQPRKDCLGINDAIREVLELTHGEVVENGVSVQAQLADGLPLIEGDRVQLQQVILNLIVNAVDAMSGVDEATRELRISSEPDAGGGVLVTVRDTGPGFAPGNCEQLFEAFYTTKPSGLGLGLSICRSIIEAHGGRLWASANLPHGATFQITVPAGPSLASR